MPIAPELLCGQHMFFDAVEIIDHRHPAPANAKGGMDIGLRPFEDFAQLRPIGHIFEIQMLNRRACDD